MRASSRQSFVIRIMLTSAVVWSRNVMKKSLKKVSCKQWTRQKIQVCNGYSVCMIYPLSLLGRPLPPPSNEGDGESKSDGSHDSNATPPSTDILGITIHGTDELQASVLLSHPSIRVSVINGNSGELLKKSVPEKCVTSYYERGNPSVDYILPILTQPFECRRHR